MVEPCKFWGNFTLLHIVDSSWNFLLLSFSSSVKVLRFDAICQSMHVKKWLQKDLTKGTLCVWIRTKFPELQLEYRQNTGECRGKTSLQLVFQSALLKIGLHEKEWWVEQIVVCFNLPSPSQCFSFQNPRMNTGWDICMYQENINSFYSLGVCGLSIGVANCKTWAQQCSLSPLQEKVHFFV